jgi:myo-inositol-1(or 4)-monophosphatase
MSESNPSEPANPVPAPLAAFAEFAVEIARRGGRAARDWMGSRTPDRKADDSPVTEADHAVQAMILDAIADAWPDHAVLVEETVARPERHAGPHAEFCWVIDPIDGTRNFARRARTFSTAVALMRGGVPVVGAIYDARFDSVIHAASGGGAFSDGRALHVMDMNLNPRCVIGISSFRDSPAPPGVRALLDEFNFRNLGSQCLHLSSLAEGDVDAVLSWEAKAWDIAAGAAIVEEAGGRMTSPDGGSLWPLDVRGYARTDMPFVAAAPVLHGELLGRVAAG